MDKSPTQILIEKGEVPSKFVLVGMSGILVNYIILYLTAIIMGVDEKIAIAISIYISMTTNYTLNRIWTFNSSNTILREYLKYIVSNLLGGLLQWTVTLIILELFDIDTVNILDDSIKIPFLLVANTVGIGVGFISNFLFAKYVVF